MYRRKQKNSTTDKILDTDTNPDPGTSVSNPDTDVDIDKVYLDTLNLIVLTAVFDSHNAEVNEEEIILSEERERKRKLLKELLIEQMYIIMIASKVLKRRHGVILQNKFQP